MLGVGVTLGCMRFIRHMLKTVKRIGSRELTDGPHFRL